MTKFDAMHFLKPVLYITFAVVFLSACRTTRPDISDTRIVQVEKEAHDSVLNTLPDYSESLYSVSGKGRAIVSEPGNSDRVTIEFETDTLHSLITIKNRIGIVGAEMLVDQDSILIYNKLDKVAQKVSIIDSRLTSLNELASINLIDLLNYKIKSSQVASIERHYEGSNFTTFIIFKTGGYARVSEEKKEIEYVEQPRFTGLPYSAIRYENYGEINGYILPRKITILSADEASKVIFQVRSLDTNPGSLNLKIDLPNDIPIERI